MYTYINVTFISYYLRKCPLQIKKSSNAIHVYIIYIKFKMSTVYAAVADVNTMSYYCI